MAVQEKSISLFRLNINNQYNNFVGRIVFAIFIANSIYAAAIPFVSSENNSPSSDYHHHGLGRIDLNLVPSNPMIDRAKGYLLSGKAKSAVENYGNFISWEEYPAGGWGKYSYLPNLSFVAGVPGQAYSSDFHWEETFSESGLSIWKSEEAFSEWFDDVDSLVLSSGVFRTIAYDVENDQGKIALYKETLASINSSDGVQWAIDYEPPGYICLYLHDYLTDTQNGPNRSNQRIGLVYPWAYRPSLIERLPEFDFFDYGKDGEEWTYGYCKQEEDNGHITYIYERSTCDNNGLDWVDELDQYDYYGATFQESYFTRNDTKADWQASTGSRETSHNLDITAGDIFGGVELMPGFFVTDVNDPSPLLAHSKYSNTWPTKYDSDKLEHVAFWPGWWADHYYGESPETWKDAGITDCDGTRQDDDCWKPVENTHISDMDVYMEFDDRWAHRGNQIENNQYLQTGYPLGLHVEAMAHSYGISYAEDIMFVTVKIRNESGQDPVTGKWLAVEREGLNNFNKVLDDKGVQISGEGMRMPDGTLLNGGKGFDYKKLFLGFYMDADVLAGGLAGYSGLHSNDDDFMEYIDCEIPSEFYPDGECRYINGEKLRVSMATIYDYDGNSGVTDIGMVAVQLLDSPKATQPVDLDKDGEIDLEIGEPLKMTDWHWFDWYNRPGVVNRESNSGSYAGSGNSPQARNKEEINYKIIAGDTTNLSDNEKRWYFHTDDPATDMGERLNPHFDSLEGLSETEFFTTDPDGLDCVLEMSSGPFDLKVGEQVAFSFCIIFGQNHIDLVRNAEFAQIMYNAHYQGYTPPDAPKVGIETDHEKVTLYWTDFSEKSKDIVTTYTDFEGYKIYKSVDGGNTWGDYSKRVFDDEGILVGWQPYAQFDLSAAEDSAFCILGIEADSCKTTADCDPCKRNQSFSGPDTQAPWFSLGDNSGLDGLRLDVPKMGPVVNNSDGSKDTTWYHYAFVDSNYIENGILHKNVTDGIQYSYSVVAYDIGVMAADTTLFNQQLQISAIEDPGNWSQISPYQYIENSKGTTIFDANFVTAIAGHIPDASKSLNKIKVVPNPYIVGSMMNETEYLRQLRFTQIPAKCTIKIYTVTGEFVFELNHDDEDDGNIYWDMRTINNQEVSPGLYLFAVKDENSGKSHVGKFAIVR